MEKLLASLNPQCMLAKSTSSGRGTVWDWCLSYSIILACPGFSSCLFTELICLCQVFVVHLELSLDLLVVLFSVIIAPYAISPGLWVLGRC